MLLRHLIFATAVVFALTAVLTSFASEPTIPHVFEVLALSWSLAVMLVLRAQRRR